MFRASLLCKLPSFEPIPMYTAEVFGSLVFFHNIRGRLVSAGVSFGSGLVGRELIVGRWEVGGGRSVVGRTDLLSRIFEMPGHSFTLHPLLSNITLRNEPCTTKRRTQPCALAKSRIVAREAMALQLEIGRVSITHEIRVLLVDLCVNDQRKSGCPLAKST